MVLVVDSVHVERKILAKLVDCKFDCVSEVCIELSLLALISEHVILIEMIFYTLD